MTIDPEDIWLLWPDNQLKLQIRGADAARALLGDIVPVATASKTKGSKVSRLQVRFNQTDGSAGRWEVRMTSRQTTAQPGGNDCTWFWCLPTASSPKAESTPDKKAAKEKAHTPLPHSGKPHPHGVGSLLPYRRILATVAPDVFVDIGSHPVAHMKGMEIYVGTRIPAKIVTLIQKRENPGIRENWNERPITLLRKGDSKGHPARWYWIPGHPPLASIWDLPLEKWKHAATFVTVRDPFRWADPRTLKPKEGK